MTSFSFFNDTFMLLTARRQALLKSPKSLPSWQENEQAVQCAAPR